MKHNKTKVDNFFGSVVDLEQLSVHLKPSAIVVTHLLADRPPFIDAISKLADVCAILPKPKTIDHTTKMILSQRYPVRQISREEANDEVACLNLLNKYGNGRPLILIDIGGYFSKSAVYLCDNYQGKILGIVEDTENGHQKYSTSRHQCPIVSVARSPLKNPEDFLVGQSIVFSTEALLREMGQILHGRTACVLGYGKLGSSIAELLHARNVKATVYDTNPLKRIEALAHGHAVANNLTSALKGANLIFCATGNKSLKHDQFKLLEDGSFVITVTSADDELDMSGILESYSYRHISDFVTIYECKEKYFYLLNRGQAVNFIHGASVGPFIFLIQGEILAAIEAIICGSLKAGIQELSESRRACIADRWLDIFGPQNSE